MGRALVALTYLFLHAATTEQEPLEISGRLESITNFWFAGFRKAYSSVFGADRGPDSAPFRLNNTRVFLEIVWAFLYWYAIVLFYRSPPFWPQVPAALNKFVVSSTVLAASLVKLADQFPHPFRTLLLVCGVVLVVFILAVILAPSEDKKEPAKEEDKQL